MPPPNCMVRGGRGRQAKRRVSMALSTDHRDATTTPWMDARPAARSRSLTNRAELLRKEQDWMFPLPLKRMPPPTLAETVPLSQKAMPPPSCMVRGGRGRQAKRRVSMALGTDNCNVTATPWMRDRQGNHLLL